MASRPETGGIMVMATQANLVAHQAEHLPDAPAA